MIKLYNNNVTVQTNENKTASKLYKDPIVSMLENNDNLNNTRNKLF